MKPQAILPPCVDPAELSERGVDSIIEWINDVLIPVINDYGTILSGNVDKENLAKDAVGKEQLIIKEVERVIREVRIHPDNLDVDLDDYSQTSHGHTHDDLNGLTAADHFFPLQGDAHNWVYFAAEPSYGQAWNVYHGLAHVYDQNAATHTAGAHASGATDSGVRLIIDSKGHVIDFLSGA